jgi:hypothetical protein
MPWGGDPAFGGKGIPGIPCAGGNGICGGGHGRCAGRPAGRGPEKFIGGGMPGWPIITSACYSRVYGIFNHMHQEMGKAVVLQDRLESRPWAWDLSCHPAVA